MRAANARPRGQRGPLSAPANADAGACNCSGNAGMLHGAPFERTRRRLQRPDHPVQTRLIQLIGALGGVDLSGTARGIDGCGIPVSASPGGGRPGDGNRRPGRFERAASRRQAYRGGLRGHSLMLSGTDTFNSTVLAETGTRALIKAAPGVYTAALPELGLGVCVKADDGARARRWRWARSCVTWVSWTPPRRLVWRPM